MSTLTVTQAAALPRIEAKFRELPEGWAIFGNATDIAAAVKAGHVIIVKGNGKTTIRPIVRQIDQVTALVGPKVYPAKDAAIAVKPTAKGKSTEGLAGTKVTTSAVPYAANVDLAAMAAAMRTAGFTSAEVLAALTEHASKVVNVTVPVAQPRNASPAQIAARERFSAASKLAAAERAATKAVGNVVGTIGMADGAGHLVTLHVPKSGDICLCKVGKATHVHHKASALADVSIRTCRDCAKSVSGEDVITALTT